MTSALLVAMLLLAAACAVLWRLWRSATLRAASSTKAAQSAENRAKRAQQELSNCRDRMARMAADHRRHVSHLQDESDRRALIAEAAAETRARLDAVAAGDLNAAAEAINLRYERTSK